MNMDQSPSNRLQDELDNLQETLLEMAGLVEKNIAKAGMAVLEPLLTARDDSTPSDVIVMGTVKGESGLHTEWLEYV